MIRSVGNKSFVVACLCVLLGLPAEHRSDWLPGRSWPPFAVGAGASLGTILGTIALTGAREGQSIRERETVREKGHEIMSLACCKSMLTVGTHKRGYSDTNCI